MKSWIGTDTISEVQNGEEMEKIRIKYFTDKIEPLTYKERRSGFDSAWSGNGAAAWV